MTSSTPRTSGIESEQSKIFSLGFAGSTTEMPASPDASNAPFLAPPETDETPAPAASDRGEATMQRLRHPFNVSAS